MLPEHYVFTGQQNLRRPRRKFPGENISCFSCRGQCIVVFAGAKSQVCTYIIDFIGLIILYLKNEKDGLLKSFLRFAGGADFHVGAHCSGDGGHSCRVGWYAHLYADCRKRLVQTSAPPEIKNGSLKPQPSVIECSKPPHLSHRYAEIHLEKLFLNRTSSSGKGTTKCSNRHIFPKLNFKLNKICHHIYSSVSYVGIRFTQTGRSDFRRRAASCLHITLLLETIPLPDFCL